MELASVFCPSRQFSTKQVDGTSYKYPDSLEERERDGR